jgi:hypothetical protein
MGWKNGMEEAEVCEMGRKKLITKWQKVDRGSFHFGRHPLQKPRGIQTL